MTDFATEWRKVQRGEPSRLFASDQIYGVKVSPRHSTKIRPTTTTRTCSSRPHYANTSSQKQYPSGVWSEYAGNAALRGYQYSPILAKKQHQAAMAVFDKAERILTNAAKSW